MKHRFLGLMVLLAATACTSSGGDTASDSNSGLSAGASSSSSSSSSSATQGPPTTTEPTSDTGTTAGSASASVTGTGTGTVTGTGTLTEGSTAATITGEGTTAGTSTGALGTTGEMSTGTTGAMNFCDGQGGILLPGDVDVCTGDLGKKTFLFAICSCSGVTANNTLKTDSFDSEMMNMMVMDGGSVGVNGAYSASSAVDIGGSLWVDGKIQTFNTHEVAQILQCGADITAGSPSHVGDDVFLEGSIFAQNKTMTIDGDLHIQAGQANNGAVVKGKTLKEAVIVKTPCDCSDPIDIAAIVNGYMQDNDNDTIPVEVDELVAIPDPKVLELPCGRYFFSGISSNNTLTIKLTGRTVIAIAGDVKTAGAFAIELGPDAELDLFVGGNVDFNNSAAIGDPKRPAAARMYVGKGVKFASGFVLAANLYQPNEVFTANNVAEIWGSLFVGGLQLASPLVVHYDQAILDLDGCEDPGKGCTDCHDCANPTPSCNKDGNCSPCVVDSDCCPPLVCDGGACKAIIPG